MLLFFPICAIIFLFYIERSVTMPYLISLTKDDFREYRKEFGKVEYSFTKKGEPPLMEAGLIKQLSMTALMNRNDYNQIMDSPRSTLYLFKSDEDNQTIGVLAVTFDKKICTISEFCVFEHFKGLGTKLFEEVCALCREKGTYEIELWCGFPGSQEFWKKLGFYERKPFIFYKRISRR